MKKILVTGGFGFVGGRLVRKLSAQHSVIVSSRKLLPGDLRLPHGDVEQVLHESLLSKETFPAGCDTVIHLAALNEKDCVSRPSEAIRVNIDETRMILENAIGNGVQQFIFFSTAHIYGSPLQGNINEQTLPVPVHPYAITHKAAEDFVMAASQAGRIKGMVIRLSNAFGAPVLPSVNRWTLLVNDLCRQAIETKKLTLFSNGCQYRDFVCLTDVETAISQMVNRADIPTGIFNLGSGNAISVMEMAKAIGLVYEELFGEKITIQLPEGSRSTTEPSLHYMIDRLNEWGIAMQNDIKNEIGNMLLFCRQHFKFIG